MASAVTERCGNRTPVSLRLPAEVASAVTAYAEEHGLRKTDAYLHFLERGLRASDEGQAFDRLSSQIDEVISLLRAQRIDAISTGEVMNAIAMAAKGYPAIGQAFLFGSFARGTQRPESDVDIQLVLDRTKRFNLRDLSLFAKQMEQLTRRECDVVTADSIEDAAFVENIETDRILAYEREAR